MFNRLPAVADLTIQEIFAQIQSGENLYQVVFTEESLDAANEDLEQTYHKETSTEGEESPPAYTGHITDLRVRAFLECLAVQEHEL